MLHEKKRIDKYLLIGLSMAIVLGLALVLPMQTSGQHAAKCFCPYVKSTQYGGGGGEVFSDNLTEVVKITQIVVRCGSYIDAIEVTYLLTSGETLTIHHGGTGGNPSIIPFKDGEYITRIDGKAGDYIDQLTFTTNLGGKFGPFGGGGGAEFSIGNLHVGGFFGRNGSYIDAIGVFTSAK